MDRADDAFVAYLSRRKPKAVYLKTYCGNSGDSLIWMGNEILLKDLGIPQVIDPKAADMILWPGGNPAMWQGHLDGWAECGKLFPNVEFAIAPATFQSEVLDWRTALKSTSAHLVGVFARDPVSYENLKSLGLSPKIAIGL